MVPLFISIPCFTGPLILSMLTFGLLASDFDLKFYSLVNTVKVMSSQAVNLLTLFMGWFN